MNSNIQTEDNRGMEMMLIGVSVSILLLHFYRYCPLLFSNLIPPEGIVGKLVTNFSKMPIFDGVFGSKLLALTVFVFYVITDTRKNNKNSEWRPALICFLAGVVAYFLMYPAEEDIAHDSIYILICTGGYIAAITGSARLWLFLKGPWKSRDVFNKEGTSFPQQEKLIETQYSVHLRGEYWWTGKRRKSWINIVNPRRGTVVMGSPGSGKSWYVIENMTRQFIEMGFSLFVYDFKYPSLTHLVYNHFLKYRDRYPEKTEFFTINFDDLYRSNRCNCIHPSTLDDIADAFNVSETVLLSGNKSWVGKRGEFWIESPINLLAGVIWFLRKYEGGKYCTLPHVIELIHTPYEQLLSVLSTEPEVEHLISTFKFALENKNMELVDGIFASVKTPLDKLISPDLYYILSGDDFELDINHPQAPKIFCLGGSVKKQEALAPVLSLYIDRTCHLINRQGKYPSSVICDEFPTVRATSILTVMSTGRENNISSLIAFQDFNQLKINYSEAEANSLLNIPGNIICGQVHGESAKLVSARFLPIMQTQISRSVNSRDTSVSESERPGTAISPATLSNLSSGEFVGILADDPEKRTELKGFHAHIINDKASLEKEKANWQELPEIGKLDEMTINNNYHQIKLQIRNLVKNEISRITQDPEL